MWTRLDDTAAYHPKLLRVSHAARWLWISGLCYCARYLTDGVIPRDAIPTLTAEAHDEALASSLLRELPWESRPDGNIRVHHWEHYNPSAAKVLDVREKRRRAGQTGGMRSGEARREAHAEAFATPQATAKRQAKSKHVDVDVYNSESPPISPSGGRHSRATFVPPEPDEIAEYAAAVGLPDSQVEEFADYYTSNGWRIGSSPMRDWRAALRRWNRTWQTRNTSVPPRTPGTHPSGEHVETDAEYDARRAREIAHTNELIQENIEGRKRQEARREEARAAGKTMAEMRAIRLARVGIVATT